MIDFGSDQGYLPYTPARMTTSMMCVWAGLAMAAVLGTALAMDLPAAAECALTQAGGGAPGGFRGGTPDPAAGELDNAWVMHSLAELTKENEKRKAELQREKDERKAEQRQMQRVIKSQHRVEQGVHRVDLRPCSRSTCIRVGIYRIEPRRASGHSSTVPGRSRAPRGRPATAPARRRRPRGGRGAAAPPPPRPPAGRGGARRRPVARRVRRRAATSAPPGSGAAAGGGI
jgi:hypothetical protein